MTEESFAKKRKEAQDNLLRGLDGTVQDVSKEIHEFFKSSILDCIFRGSSQEELSDEVIEALSHALCGGVDPKTELPRLKEALGVGGPCGKVLQYGEPTFICLECALDNTCVMCMECYNASPHHTENHKLLVNTSQGSGMCDCGDQEAWKYGSTCKLHAGTSDGDAVEVDMKLPAQVRRAATALFKELLHLSMLVFLERGEGLVEELDLPVTLQLDTEADQIDMSDRYVTVIYNDEVHNFDEVIAQFKHLLSSTHSEASAYATSIDREGRMLVCNGGREDCAALTTKFLEYKPRDSRLRSNKEPLVTRSMMEYKFVLQNLLIGVVDWMSDMARGNAAFRRIICNVSLTSELSPSADKTFVEQVMLLESYFWKKVKCAWHSLFMSSYFGDAAFKKDIGVMFIKNYAAMFKSFLEDEKVREFSYCIISLTVQLFTVPSISTLLMTEYYAIETVFDQYVSFYSKFVKEVNGVSKLTNLSFKSNSAMSKQRTRINHVLADTRYILSYIPKDISEETEDAFLRFLEIFVDFLSNMQEMNPHVRESNNHILREKEWDQYFFLEINEIRTIMPSVARWCTATPRLYVKSLEVLLKTLVDNSTSWELSQPGPVVCYHSLRSLTRWFGGSARSATAAWELYFQSQEMETQRIFAYDVEYIQHDMFRDPVSFHLPLTRLLAIVFSHFTKFDLPMEPLQKILSPEELMDVPLRALLLSQQIEANMWKRNGTTMDHQSSCYRDICKSTMWDKDLLAVQMLLTLCEPTHALLRIVNKYKIEPYLVLAKCETATFDPLVRMAEAFAALMLFTLCERFRINVSEAKESEILRKDAVHILAISNLPRSKIIKSLDQHFIYFDESITKSDEIDSILNKIATKVPVEDGVKTIMKLKTEYYNEFTPFYYHYSHGQRQKAENNFYQKNSANQEFRPPPLPAFTKLTKHLRKYLISPVIQRFIYVVLRRFCDSESPIMVSDLLLHQVLYITMFGVLDELNTPEDPLPTKFTHNITRADNPDYLIVEDDTCSIVSLLRKLITLEVKSVTEIKPLIRWILKTVDKLTNSPAASEVSSPMVAEDSPKKAVDSRKEMLRKRRQALLANFQKKQNTFMMENAEVFEDIDVAGSAPGADEMEVSALQEHVVCGPNKGPLPRPDSLTLTCILCKDSEKVSSGFSNMMYGCLIEKSVVLKPEKDEELSGEYRVSSLLGGPDLHIQSCGHLMHLRCLQNIMKLSPALQHFLTMTGADRAQAFLLNKGEFTCPYCKMTANCVLPVIGHEPRTVPDVSTEEFLEDVSYSLESNNDIEMMELEFSEAPDHPIPGPTDQPITIGLEQFAEATNILEILRDAHGELNRQLFRFNDNAPSSEQVSSEPTEEPDPVDKFKDDMKRFYRRAKNVLDHDAVGGKCYAPFTMKMVAYTFSMLEYILRGKPLLAGLAEYQEDFFESFLRSLHKSITMSDHLYNQELTREMLYIFAPECSQNLDLPSILNTDIFTVFVAARFAIYNEGKSYDNALVELCVAAETIKILLSVSPDELSGTDTGADDADAIQLATMWGHVRAACGYSGTDAPFQCPTYLVSRVKEALLPLLRKLALFLRYSTCIPGSATMKELQSGLGEFALLLKYLNINSLSCLLNFEGDSKTRVLQKWFKTIDREKFSGTAAVRSRLRQAKLIDLPKSFVDLLVRASQYSCPKVKFGKIQTTAVCLVCGDLVCFQSYCCQEPIVDAQGPTTLGPCNAHAHRCSGDIGVFLILEKCQVLLLPVKTQGIFINGPYVDKYGEGYKSTKNKALHLSAQIYKKIETMWVKHEIRPMVARNTDGGAFSRMEQISLLY